MIIKYKWTPYWGITQEKGIMLSEQSTYYFCGDVWDVILSDLKEVEIL